MAPAADDGCPTPKLREGDLAHAILNDAHLRILYLTPEELATKDANGQWSEASAELQYALAACPKELRMWVFDEVHLVSDWGETFRAAYRHVNEACNAVDERRRSQQARRALRMATTATLTQRQSDLLGDSIGMREFEVVRGGDHARPNLHLLVRHATAAELATSSEAQLALSLLHDALGGRLPAEAMSGRVILFVSHACAAPGVAEAINEAKLSHPDGSLLCAVAYSGAMEDEARRAVMEQVAARDGARILVATCACSTGLDLPHEVTFVGHLRLPPSLLHLWQEWGRAGRGGSKAWCVLFVHPAFVSQMLRFVTKEPRAAVRTRLVQELVDVVALAMLPGCCRRLLNDMVGSESDISSCASCDACCTSGACGFWAASVAA